MLATRLNEGDKVADIVFRNVDKIKASILDQKTISSLNFAIELNNAITSLLDKDKSRIMPWWNSLYAVLVFAVVLWLLQKIHLWIMHDNIVWTDLLLGLMM